MFFEQLPDHVDEILESVFWLVDFFLLVITKSILVQETVDSRLDTAAADGEAGDKSELGIERFTGHMLGFPLRQPTIARSNFDQTTIPDIGHIEHKLIRIQQWITLLLELFRLQIHRRPIQNG